MSDAVGVARGGFNDRGFTFLDLDKDGAKEQIFLHIRSLAEQAEATLVTPGARLEFDIVDAAPGGKNRQARNARLVSASTVPIGTLVATGRRGTVKFWHPHGFGFVVDARSGDEYYAHSASVRGGYLRLGDILEFDVQQSSSGLRAHAVNVRAVAWNQTGDAFTDTLDMGSPRWATDLAQIAEPEEWNYPVQPSRDDFIVLRNYIKYTFLRLDELGGHVLQSPDQKYLAFNTGLVTPFQEQIFAWFRRRQSSSVGPSWYLQSFEKASSASFLGVFGKSLPPLASYFDDPSQLVYDISLPLSVNVEHVPHDRSRFPEALKSLGDHDLAAQVNAKAPEAVERVRRNYKTAIPQFYRDGNSGAGKMQLLLPVALLRRDHVELALAVDRLDSGVYLGRTVLTLDWAYNNARLLTRPDTDWLKP